MSEVMLFVRIDATIPLMAAVLGRGNVVGTTWHRIGEDSASITSMLCVEYGRLLCSMEELRSRGPWPTWSAGGGEDYQTEQTPIYVVDL